MKEAIDFRSLFRHQISEPFFQPRVRLIGRGDMRTADEPRRERSRFDIPIDASANRHGECLTQKPRREMEPRLCIAGMISSRFL